ncbi:MFS transporter [Cryobacterium sp. TMT4-31]|uniref:MFS transporter n=1 Tax=Cryobacterium sp. TMT4-31 TaxID=1259259 RepID=UPI00141B318F|nr:MFS transporter [Cryobacterium sp. TMT4-31]
MAFIVPLWAGEAVGADPSQIGALLATELVIAFIARPFAGRIADSIVKWLVAVLGSLVIAVAFGVYALSDALVSLPLAFTAAAITGIGSSFALVALRAMVGEESGRSSGAFAKLLSAEETGTWASFVVGLVFLGFVENYALLFVASAAVSVIAAAFLVVARPRSDFVEISTKPEVNHAPSASANLTSRLRPLMVAVAITSVAEAALGILLLLHLQRAFNLSIVGIALVFLPGSIAAAVLPTYLHRFVIRFGRRRAVVAAAAMSSVFAAGLAFAESPLVVAALWIATGVAWATLFPIEQAIFSEISDGRVARSMGLYSAAGLFGSALGSLLGGIAYDAFEWQVACVGGAALIALGAVITPIAMNRADIADHPRGTSTRATAE